MSLFFAYYCIIFLFCRFEAGDLGPGTIVGSAAFNLLIICGVCIVALPAGETRRIRTFSVSKFSKTRLISNYERKTRSLILSLSLSLSLCVRGEGVKGEK